MHGVQKTKILVADDDDDIRLALELLLVQHGYDVIHAKCVSEVTHQVKQHSVQLMLLDMNFSRDTTNGEEGIQLLEGLRNEPFPIILMTAWASVNLAVECLKQGACDFFEKPWNNTKLLNSIEQQLDHSQLKLENKQYRRFLSDTGSQSSTQDKWISQSNPMQKVEELVRQIAHTDANILILGENGTGKSKLAQRIHNLSTRQESPFISVNMAAIPENLFESELFGHQKGAFTDAKHSRVGRFQLANKGTLFLDEIGSLPFHLQPKLLRVLETGHYETLGSSQTQQADVRLISATNANLNTMIAEHTFRQDLLYRLNTLVITMPPLRERVEDIEPLANQFIQHFCQKYSKPLYHLSVDGLAVLKQHLWPGNIRELSHVIERGVLISKSARLDTSAFMLEPPVQQSSVVVQSLEVAEKQMIEQALLINNGNIVQAAKQLDISRNALYRRLEKHKLLKSADLDVQN